MIPLSKTLRSEQMIRKRNFHNDMSCLIKKKQSDLRHAKL